jgi:Kef-type K+ transport system membrane component KefB
MAWILGALLWMAPSVALAGGGGHGGIAGSLLTLAVVLLVAKVSGHVAQKLGQPAVLGELLGGVAVGNLAPLWPGVLGGITTDAFVEGLAELGVIILLFEVGLESTVRKMLSVGPSAGLSAVLGVVAPMGLGWLAAWALLPESPWPVHMFLGATLTATSVGVTARVLKDAKASESRLARIILGAAVVDDVLGLVLLAAVTSIVTAFDAGGQVEVAGLAWIVAKAAIFLVGAVLIGGAVTPKVYRWASYLQGTGVLLALSVAFCLLLSWGASLAGLAPIVGAFAAGLILEHVHVEPFTEKGERELEDLIAPVASVLTPVFFVLMGARVELASFADATVLGLAAVLTVAALVGKLACGLGVVERGVSRLAVGLGMIPPGEVGLIFANIGLGLSFQGKGLIDAPTYSALVLVVIVTTMAGPLLLHGALRRLPDQGADVQGEGAQKRLDTDG